MLTAYSIATRRGFRVNAAVQACEFDAVVIGCGPGGSAAATFLARAGLKVLVLAMYSGKLAAQTVRKALARGDDGAREFAAYERRVRSSMRFYWRMVEAFSTTPFMEVFLEPRQNLDLPSAVNAVLAGELEGGWSMRWRLEVFFWLVWLQARWPFLPRVSFAPLPRASASTPSHAPR